MLEKAGSVSLLCLFKLHKESENELGHLFLVGEVSLVEEIAGG